MPTNNPGKVFSTKAPMKIKLTKKDRAVVQSLCVLLQNMQEMGGPNADQFSPHGTHTYGLLHDALCAFVQNQTGVYIGHTPPIRKSNNELTYWPNGVI